MREEGYYWVKFCGRWIVSEWDGNYWIIPGYISASDGTDFEEIDEKRLTHEDQNTNNRRKELIETFKDWREDWADPSMDVYDESKNNLYTIDEQLSFAKGKKLALMEMEQFIKNQISKIEPNIHSNDLHAISHNCNKSGQRRTLKIVLERIQIKLKRIEEYNPNKIFMTKIKTAEEVLINHSFEDEPFNNALKERIILCMQEYAKQFIDLAAEEAKSSWGNKSDEWGMNTYTTSWVDKESILKLKERVI